MTLSFIDSGSLLAYEIGTVTTHAILFDVVDGCYRFVAISQATSTADAPFNDVREGIQQATLSLQRITGRRFFNDDQSLAIPANDGHGVDLVAASLSAGPSIKTILAGLLEDVSLESLQRLARRTYTKVVDTISLNDRRRPEEQIDTFLQLQPELLMIAGGTDGGATRSLQKIVEIIAMTCQLLPESKRPSVLFAGNKNAAEMVKLKLQPLLSSLRICPNIRPSIQSEDLGPAQRNLNELYAHLRGNQIMGVSELDRLSANTLISTSHAMGRMIRFLGDEARKGVLGVDIGASHTTVAAGYRGHLSLGVYPDLGIGEESASILRYTKPEEIIQWLPFDIPAEQVKEHLYQKSIHPTSLPATPEDLAIEQATARQALRLAYLRIMKEIPADFLRPASHLPPYFEPIFAGGSVITQAPNGGQSLLLLLDAIQPLGFTTIILDQNNLLPALGAAAIRVPILPIQVIESPAFRYLATVVTPYSSAKKGTPILNARLIRQSGVETRVEVKQGALEVLALSPGQKGRLYLEPLHHVDIGFGAGKTRKEGYPISGTMFGVVIDGRGRPLRLPADPNQRCAVIRNWHRILGDQE